MSRGNRRILWLAIGFLLISSLTRIGLAIYSGGGFTFGEWLRFVSTGLLFDLAVAACFVVPWALYDVFLPARFRARWLERIEGLWAGIWATAYLFLFAFVAISEFVFWGEFHERFNFVAVDYLIYTHEVVRNIMESYPVFWVLGLAATVVAVVVWFTWPKAQTSRGARWPRRWATAAVAIAVAATGMTFTSESMVKDIPNNFVRELSVNGVFAFFHAYRRNEITYTRHYPMVDNKSAIALARDLIAQRNTSYVDTQGIDRKVAAHGPRRNVNIVLITVESLSAQFLGVFGNTLGLTPNLDRLAHDGLLFTNLYATGTRTVRGLEATTIGTPPTPGQSIVRRLHVDHLETLGEEVKEYGWTPHWLYGGYGLFDNMNEYFGGNSYIVTDRRDAAAEKIKIHSENVWGIADEDLFSMVLKKIDKETAAGHRFFGHVMTTSNHRPYTFPANRIDMAPGKREAGVKYTDWALGDFIRRAKTKPWFDNTLFIITADHTASAAGKTDLPIDRYHIPMIWYAPKLVPPGEMARLMSQIDIPPTLLGWLGLDYESRFFGYDMFALEPGRERAFISTYETLGYIKDGRVAVLKYGQKPTIAPARTNRPTTPAGLSDARIIREAIAMYETASILFSTGKLKEPEHIAQLQ